MRPTDLKTKIFLDSGDPNETKEVIKLLSFLDGQTTNPTLITKNPAAQKRLQEGKTFSKKEIYDFYKGVVTEISNLIPAGSDSIEVYSDLKTTDEEMFAQGKKMYTWIPNAHIKYPTTESGLSAAEKSTKENMRVNMTLCFSQDQAAAVHAATVGAKKGQVFVSPFVGRLDDINENGMDLIKNIIEMYKMGGSHVEVLSASIRTMDHFLCSLYLGADIITAPYKILKEWGDSGMPMPKDDYTYDQKNLKPISYKTINLMYKWQEFDVSHELTTQGIEKFSKDWNALVS